MMFNSIQFLFFLPIVFALYWLLGAKRVRMQNLLIVVASYIFYGAWNSQLLVLIAFTTFCSWLSGVLLERYDKDVHPRMAKFIAGTNIVVNLFILGLFKYYNFFASSLAELLGIEQDVVLLNLILPVGISFYTFQALSYTIDVYRRNIQPTQDVIAFFAYVSFFPQLVAGPIERATNLLPQFLGERRFSYEEAADGCRRMLWGFFKKLVIADLCAQYVNNTWNGWQTASSGTLILGAVFFSFQVYGDFSGYSDIAIGCSKLFGIRLRENFIMPFFSRNIPELWRRWHISLNTWFVDYVYIPLGGSRQGNAKKVRNTFVIFFLSGLWHGANWTYIGWGLFHAICFVPNMLRKRVKDKTPLQDREYRLREIPSILFVFMLFTLSVIIFRAPSIEAAWGYFMRMMTVGFAEPTYYSRAIVTPAIISIAVCLFAEWLQRHRRHPLDIAHVRWMPLRWLMYIVLFTATLLYAGDSQNFIYFQF